MSIEQVMEKISMCSGKEAVKKYLITHSYISRGEINIRLGKYEVALKDLSSAESVSDNIERKLYAIINQTVVIFRQGKLDEALEKLITIEKEYRGSIDPRNLQEIYRQMSDIVKYQGKYDLALEYLDKQESLADSLKDSLEDKELGETIKYSAMIGRGFIQSMLGDFDKALANLQQCREYYTKMDYREKLILINMEIAGIYSDQGKFKESEQMYNDVIKLSMEVFIKSHVYSAHYNLIRLYVMQKKMDKALLLIDASIQMVEDMGDLSGLSYSMLQKGVILKETLNLKNAFESFQKGLELSKKVGDPVVESACLMNIGETQMIQGTPAAGKSLKAAWKLAKKIRNYYMYITSFSYLMYYLISNDKKADLDKLIPECRSLIENGKGDIVLNSQFLRFLLIEDDKAAAESIYSEIIKHIAAGNDFDYRIYAAIIEYSKKYGNNASLHSILKNFKTDNYSRYVIKKTCKNI